MDDLSGIEKCKTMKEKSIANLLNYPFIIYPSVFNPDFFLGSDFYAKSFLNVIQEMDSRKNTLLELGTGAGYNGILAVLHGAFCVTMTDINPEAVANAQENVQRYQLENKITVICSDIFASIDGENRFDVIFWNIPFEMTEKSLDELELVERAVFDPKSQLLNRYLRDAHRYLTPNTGRLFIGYSETYGSMDNFQSLADKYDWRIRCISEVRYSQEQPVHLGLYELIKIAKN